MRTPNDEHDMDADNRRAPRWDRPLTVLVVVAAALFCVYVAADTQADAAIMREQSGLTRGPILDVLGHPVASTVNVAGNAQRVYHLPDATQAVGYQDPSGAWHGVEREFNRLLSVRPSGNVVGTLVQHIRGQSRRGGQVRLTIDPRVQRVAASALGNHKGAIVALDPRTGAVLSLVSSPSCPASSLSQRTRYAACARSPGGLLRNRATDELFAPGSIFKIVTLSAAMDTGRFHLDDVFSGADVFGPSPYFDNVLYPSNVTRPDLTALTLSQALAFSDNFTFAHIGLTLGAPTLLRYAHRFYIGRHIPFDLPVAVSRIAGGHAHPTLSQTAQSSFGATVDSVTVLQMAMIAATVANGGVLMAPHLVASIAPASGSAARTVAPRSLGRVMSVHAARDVTTAMVFVVDHGSGFNAQIPGIAVAGKTGTAADNRSKPQAWFIAFAPARHPVVAVAVLREYSGEGFQFAAPIARRILVAALAARGIRPR